MSKFYDGLIGLDISATVSPKVPKTFSVDYSLLPSPFRDFLSSTFPHFWKYVDEEVRSEGQPAEEIKSPTTAKHPGSTPSSPAAKSPRKTLRQSGRSRKAPRTFQHCTVTCDTESENEGAEFDPEQPTTVPSETLHPCSGTQSQPIVLDSLIPVIREQVNESAVGVDLVTYEQLIEKIPPLLVSAWSTNLFPVETFVDFVDHPQDQLFKQ